MRRLLSLALLGTALCHTAIVHSAECPVEQFSIQDVQRLNFSETLALSAFDLMESSDQSRKNQSLNSNLLVGGTPVNVSGSDMQEIAQYIKRTSDIRLSHNQEVSFFTSNLSLLGAKMYEICKKHETQNFEVTIPDSAYSEKQFLLKLRWTPNYGLNGKTDAIASIKVLNGTVDGQPVKDAPIRDKQSISFVIEHTDLTKTLQIVPTVDGFDNGDDSEISIAPIIKTEYTTRLRTWPGPGDPPFSPICSDDGGGNCGSEPKPHVACINAIDGILLPSSFSIQSAMNGDAIAQLRSADANKVCVDYGTYGLNRFGKKGYSGLTALSFSVREVIPAKN